MAITIGVETRRYATITVDTDDLDEAFEQASALVLEDHHDVSWNDAVVDSMSFISQTESDSGYADLMFQRMRDNAVCM